MNILFTYDAPFIPTTGGVERVTDILCKGLVERGFHCEYLTYHSRQNRNLEASPKFPCEAFFLDNSDSTLKKRNSYHAFLDSHKIDLIINQNGLFKSGNFFLDIGQRNIKRISVIHNDPNYSFDHVWHNLVFPRNDSLLELLKCLMRPLLYFRLKRIAKLGICGQLRFLEEHNDKIVFLSQGLIDNAVKHISSIKSKSIAIANPNTYAVIDKVPDKDPNECLFVGRFDNKSKNLKTLLDIWDIIYKKNHNAHLSLLGYGESEDMLKNYVARKKIENVSFCPRQNPKIFYERASFFCMTSLYEGFPMTLTEAMCHACIPVVFDSFPSVHDILRERSGCVIKAFRKQEYANVILRLMNDDSSRLKIATNALEGAKRFRAKNIVNKWIALINKLVK